jgi:hypothetical protein
VTLKIACLVLLSLGGMFNSDHAGDNLELIPEVTYRQKGMMGKGTSRRARPVT